MVIHKTRKPDPERDPDQNAWRDIIVYSLCLSTCFIGILIYFLFGGGKDFFRQLGKMNQIESQLEQQRKTSQEEKKN